MMLIAVKPLGVQMNDEDISQFISAFEDFMKHAEETIHSQQQWMEARYYSQQYYEQKAAELGLSVEYYLSEFV